MAKIRILPRGDAEQPEDVASDPSPSPANGAFALLAQGVRAGYASQDAAQALTYEAYTRGQQVWWDGFRRMTEVSLAAFAPVTARELDERFESAERRADQDRQQLRRELDQATTALGEASREQVQSIREVVRETAREQRAARAGLEESIAKLDTRLDRLTKAEGKQLEEVRAALTEHEQHLRERLGDRIRTAIGSIEAAKPGDLEQLRRQLATLAESVTATRAELATLAGEIREERAATRKAGSASRSDSAPREATGQDRGEARSASSKASGKQEG